MLAVPSRDNGGGTSTRDSDTLSDVVMDDSRAPSRAISPAVAVGPSKLSESATITGDNDEEDDEEEEEQVEEEEEDEMELDDDEDGDQAKSTSKSMTPRQKEKAAARTAQKEKKQATKNNLSGRKESVNAKKVRALAYGSSKLARLKDA